MHLTNAKDGLKLVEWAKKNHLASNNFQIIIERTKNSTLLEGGCEVSLRSLNEQLLGMHVKND